MGKKINLVITGLIGAFLICLSGCDTAPKLTQQPEDPEVLARCTPVRDLLSKNFHRQNNLDLAVVNVGSLYKTEGAVLSGEEAARIADIDTACRAWVYHIISGEDYARKVLGITSATIVATSRSDERDAIAASAAAILSELKRQGLLPKELDPSNLPPRVEEDTKLTRKQLEDSLAVAMAGLGEQVRQYPKSENERQAQILARIAQLEKSLTERQRPTEPGATPPDISPTLEIYFTTMSAELTYDSRIRLKEAGERWRTEGKTVDVTGYTDPRGDVVSNLKLAKSRADNVAAVLIQLGLRLGDVTGQGVRIGSSDYDQLRVVRVIPK